MAVGRLCRMLTVIITTLAALAVGVGSASSVVTGTAWTFPGTCNTTYLYQCVSNVAQPGDTVVVVTNQPVQFGVTIDKSLTLTAGPGYSPTLPYVAVPATSGIAVTVRGLTMSSLGVAYSTTPGSTFVGDRLRILGENVNNSVVSVDASIGGSFRLANSEIRNNGNQSSMDMRVNPASGRFDLSVLRTAISGHDASTDSTGIYFQVDGGDTDALLANNTIWDVDHCSCGSAAGIGLRYDGAGRHHVTMVGNTIDRTKAYGVLVLDDVDAGGRLAVDLSDNIISRAPGSGVTVFRGPSAVRPQGHVGHNLYFRSGKNQLAGLSAGTGNLVRDPRFVDEAHGDLTLHSTSPAIDHGAACPPGGVVATDAAQHNRLAGRTVDIGAFEHDAGAPTGVVRIGGGGADTMSGGPGADILCGNGGADVLHGRAGNDLVMGGDGGDRVYGDDGADRLDGGSGTDKVYGGDGADPCLDVSDGHRGDVVNGGKGSDGGSADRHDTRTSIEHGCR